MFFNNLKRKISTGHIGKQDTFDPPPPLPPPPSEHVQKFIRFGRLTLPYIPYILCNVGGSLDFNLSCRDVGRSLDFDLFCGM